MQSVEQSVCEETIDQENLKKLYHLNIPILKLEGFNKFLGFKWPFGDSRMIELPKCRTEEGKLLSAEGTGFSEDLRMQLVVIFCAYLILSFKLKQKKT